ncbi:polyamine aminopropyltransferase [candidate division KSB1 bacterium]|nr:polyamine aminopropyltransferase [candidate division KSB1 bacterium]RQW03137.1 MAG: polyamine aminopropyltransferase [candidate division KSB1 bacterium]
MNSFLAHQFPFTLFRKTTRESIVLYLSMFIMGACGLAYEYTLSKVASDILGNSVRQWAIIIGIMMFFMGVGSDVQKYFSNTNLVDKFILFEILIGLLGAFGPIALLVSYGSIPSHYVLVQYFFVTSIGLIIGFEIPIITRINETYIQELKLNLGNVLKMDYIGALVGSLLWIFLLPRFFTIVETAFVLGILNVLVALFTLIFFRKLVMYRKSLALLTFIVTAALFVGLFSSARWTIHAEQQLFRDRVIFSKTTTFQHIVLTESRAGDIACYINGQLQFHSADEFIYHENLVHPAFVLAPYHQKVLILGGGDGLALREVLKYDRVESVTICDIDPAMTTLAKENEHFQRLNGNSLADSRITILKNNALTPGEETVLAIEDQRQRIIRDFEVVTTINIINLDAAKFIEQISGLYDIIIIDFPDPNNPDLSKLYSDMFYHNIRKKLTADGIFIQQSTSPVHAREVFLLIGRTIKSAGLVALPFHDNVPSFGEWGWWIGGRSDRWSPETIRNKIRSTTSFEVATQYLTPAVMNAAFEFGLNQLQSDNTSINTITNGLAFSLYVKAWNI